MTPHELVAVEALLVSERERVRAAIVDLSTEHDSVIEASGHANLDDEHDPEGATVGFERAGLASLLRGARRRLTQLDESVERLYAGTYGTCGQCGTLVAFERLLAWPTAETCASCASTPARSPSDRP